MAFKLTSRASEVTDYSIPMPNGDYIFDITEVKVVPKKKQPSVNQWRIAYKAVGMVDDMGFIDTEHAGRTIGYNHFQIDIENTFTRALFVAVGTEHEIITTDGEDVTEFTFDDSVNSEADLPIYLQGKQILCAVTTKLDNTGTPRNNAGFAKPITEEVNQMLLELQN